MSRPGYTAMSAADALISAIQSFDVDTVEKLVKSDLEIECGNLMHPSAWHFAVQQIAVVQTSLEIDLFQEESNQPLNNPLNKPEPLQRIIEVLLESGRYNVDALTNSCHTALHHAIEYCNCRLFTNHYYKDLGNSIIKFILKNKANINAKTIKGETPLMRASERGCSHIVQLLLIWRDELGTGVDLNARDIYGETALIKAAKYARVDVVELLLQHGCLDEFHDHRGFYALHAVIYGPDSKDDVSDDFFKAIGLDASEKANTDSRELSSNWKRNNKIQKIVTMLVTAGRGDLNSPDFRGNTVLDLAVKSKIRISNETIDMLMTHGARFGAFTNEDSINPGNTFQTVDKMGKTPLHFLSVALSRISTRDEVIHSAKLLNISPFKELFEAMAVKKDHRGRTAMHYAVMIQLFSSNDLIILKPILKLLHILNERDNYGRTPLHYCQSEKVYKSVVMRGADEHIRDIDGKTPRELRQLRKIDRNRHDLSLQVIKVLKQLDAEHYQDGESDDDECNNDESKGDECKNKALDAYKEWTDTRKTRTRKLEDQSIQRTIDTWTIWKDSKYAYRDQFSTIMRDRVQHFMNRLSDEIRKKDPRFECRPVLIGSAEEGTKTGLPDEFDFNFILTKLGELCEVVPSPEAPSGFIHLKRRSCSSRNQLSSQGFQSQEDFDRLFSCNGFLLTTEIASRFRILYLQIMREPEFWDGENVFEWHTCNEIGLLYSKEEGHHYESNIANDFMPSTHLCSTIQLKLNRPIAGRYMFTPISIDIVPCIQPDNWWPEKALSGVCDEIKLGGCHLVFDQPQKKYPWVPFSNSFARISFAPAESRIIRECSAVARAAFMVGKQLLYYYHKSNLTYVLKTCLLYCLEALKDNTRYVSIYEDIDQSELRFFVEKLMLCFHEFYLLDFLPCYLMPSFHLPMGDYLKSNHEKLLSDSSFQYPTFAYELYRIVCGTEILVDFCPDPLNERFKREELMRNLSMDRSYIVIYRRVQPETLETEQMVWSDSESGSQVCFGENRKRRMEINADKTKVKKQYCIKTK